KSKAVVTSVINQLNLRDDPEFNGKGGWLQSVWEPIRARFGGARQGGEKPIDTLIADFQDQLSVLRVGGTVVEVAFNSTSPERAAEIANATARAYIDDQLKSNADSYRSAMTWLHDRLQELGNDALAAERSVNELKSKNNIVAPDGKLIDDQQIS